MKIELEPLLGGQREIYDLPLGRDRFLQYIDVMTAGTREMALPLTLMNPMGKPHVAAFLDSLIELRAEEIAADAVGEALERLAGVAGAVELRLGLVVVDDAGGGWTNRYTTEMAHRFGRSGELKRGWIVGLLWTSEAPSADSVRSEVLSSIYRAVHRLRHGDPEGLRGRLLQEGRAAAFGSSDARPPEPALERARAELEAHLDSASFPIQFACLYGDEIAESLGYRALGLPPHAGYRLAAEDARNSPLPPEAALT